MSVLDNIQLKYDPLPKQRAFHESGVYGKYKYRALAGGVGSGKTIAGAWEAFNQSVWYPKNFGLIGRQTYPELRDSTWKEFINLPIIVDGKEVPLVQSPLIIKYNKSEHEVTFVNGSVVIGRALEGAENKVGKALTLGWAWIDEITETSKEMYMLLASRLRLRPPCKKCGLVPQGNKTICPRCKIPIVYHTLFATTNPEGHDWFWQTFVADPKHNYWFDSVKTSENFHLPENYEKDLRNQYPKEWCDRYLDASFDTFSGLIYHEYRDTEPFICKPFTIPEHWYKFVALDHGLRHPTAVVWGAVDGKGNCYIYDEYRVSDKIVSDHAVAIKVKTGDTKIQQWIIDGATKQRNGATGRSIYTEYEDNGLYFILANKDVRAGINHVKEYLKIQEDGKPRLRIFSTCKDLRIEMQTWKWKDIKAGTNEENTEKPVKTNDDLLDALRYLIMYIYDTPQGKKKEFTTKDLIRSIGRSTVEAFDWMSE